MLDPLRQSILRQSTRYQLVVFDRLSAKERELLGDLQRAPDFYGILRPTAAGKATIKAVGRETALLIFTLRESGRLPAYVFEEDDASDRLAEIKSLILDGVLEVQDQDQFVSGPAALRQLSTQGGGNVDGALARLSCQALRYAAAVNLDSVERVADRLYAFQCIPTSPRWQRTLGNADTIKKHLGIAPGNSRRRRLIAWGRSVTRRSEADWLGWTRRDDEGSQSARAPTYKLYISPQVEAIEPVFAALLDVLPQSRAGAFKIGGEAASLLRPDKLVVYFSDFDALALTAAELAAKVAEYPTHGVPFTAEIGGDGLLSWGLDPPYDPCAVPWQASESWRLWIVRRLAAALMTAQANPSDAVTPWRFALERLRLHGIDVERWMPRPNLWRSED